MAFLNEEGSKKLSKNILGKTVLMFGGIDTTTPASSIAAVGITDTNYSASKIKWNNAAKYFTYALDGKYYNTFGDPKTVNCSDTYQTTSGSTTTPKQCLYYNISNKRLYYWNGSTFDQLTDSNTTYSAGNGLTLSGTTFSLKQAASNTLGGIIPAGSKSTAIGDVNITDTNTARRYGVLTDSTGKAYVNVPWTDNNTNTTYSFSNGTNGSFTVTSSNGSAQTVSIGKPSTAGTADKVKNILNMVVNGTSFVYDGSESKLIIVNFLDERNRIIALENTVASALVYKGTISKDTDLTNIIGDGKAKTGYCYIVTAAFNPTEGNSNQINNSTKGLEAGDMLICRTNYVNDTTKQTFDVLQSNTNGAVTTRGGTSNCLAMFNGANSLTNAGTKGNSTKPIYLNNGVPTEIGYTISANVPSNAKFTDTTYGDGEGLSLSDNKTFNIIAATTTDKGGIKLGYLQNGRKYPVLLDNEKAYVEVPWTDNNTTYGAASMSVNGIVKLGSDTVQLTTANTVTSTANRTYAVQFNSNKQLVVNVPWTDTNTTYSGISIDSINSWF